ncbi:MAG: hypothetical protein ACRDSF_03160 [Pseudonocardiaceae bacterium]
MSDPISHNDLVPTHEQILALCKLVRDGGALTVEQRHYLAELLDIVGSAVRVASQAVDIYPDAPERQDRFVAGVMESVSAAYAELLAVLPTPDGV